MHYVCAADSTQGEAHGVALAGSRAGEKGQERPDRASHAGKHFAGVGVGLDNLCWGHAPQKVFILVQGYVEIGRVLPSMQLANQTRV